jgi:pimeloyl-ACP methyl ester carboxylesterase
MAQAPDNPADFIEPLNMNGLSGRMLRAPATKKSDREILLVYGHHALLERWWGLVENLREYGNVKMRYRRRKVTIIGISFGFVIVTRMLQRSPELIRKVDFVTSIVGFMHETDFSMFNASQRKRNSMLTRFFASPPTAWLIRYGFLNAFIIRNLYVRMPAGKRRFLEMDPAEFDTMMDFEVKLWQANDVRTHWRTTAEFMHLDNCKVRIDLPVYHVASKGDHYFDNRIVEQHMQVVYNDYHQGIMDSKAHTPSVLGDKKELSIMVPTGLRRMLRRPVK